MNRPNPLLNEIGDILNEIGDPTHSKPILDTVRPTLPDKPKPTPEPSKPDNSSNTSTTTPSNTTPQPSPNQTTTTQPIQPAQPADNSSFFSHYLTPEDKKKLARYERLKLEKVSDNWEEELRRLKEDQRPFDLPPTWREELKTIEELRKRPTWEALHKAVSEEKGKYSDYSTIKSDLKTWTETFGTATAQQIKDKLDAKPTSTTLSPTDKEAIANYAKLKTDYETLKTSKDKEIGNLKNQVKIKNAEIEKLKGWKTNPAPDSLTEQIKQKVIQAYNSTDYLNGYYEKLMKQFLNWEITGNEQQKNAIKETKIEVNKCLKFLEEIGTIKNPNIKV